MWSIQILAEQQYLAPNDKLPQLVPAIQLQDVPPVWESETAASEVPEVPSVYDTSFRVFPRSIEVFHFAPVSQAMGIETDVVIKFRLGTPLVTMDVLQITAPRGFEWTKVIQNNSNMTLLGNEAAPFPGKSVDIDVSKPFIIRIDAMEDCEANVSYGITLKIQHPSMVYYTAVTNTIFGFLKLMIHSLVS